MVSFGFRFGLVFVFHKWFGFGLNPLLSLLIYVHIYTLCANCTLREYKCGHQTAKSFEGTSSMVTERNGLMKMHEPINIIY